MVNVLSGHPNSGGSQEEHCTDQLTSEGCKAIEAFLSCCFHETMCSPRRVRRRLQGGRRPGERCDWVGG
eukprot:10927757-Lingulodinium_polyedra.AAC.1